MLREPIQARSRVISVVPMAIVEYVQAFLGWIFLIGSFFRDKSWERRRSTHWPRTNSALGIINAYLMAFLFHATARPRRSHSRHRSEYDSRYRRRLFFHSHSNHHRETQASPLLMRDKIAPYLPFPSPLALPLFLSPFLYPSIPISGNKRWRLSAYSVSPCPFRFIFFSCSSFPPSSSIVVVVVVFVGSDLNGNESVPPPPPPLYFWKRTKHVTMMKTTGTKKRSSFSSYRCFFSGRLK